MSYSQPIKDFDGGQNMSRSASSTDSGLPSLSRQDTPLSLDYYYGANNGSSSTSSLYNQSHISPTSLQRPDDPHRSHSGGSSPTSPSFFVGGNDRFSPTSLSPRLPSPSQPDPSANSPTLASKPGFGGVLSKRTDSINAKGKALSGWMMRKTSSRKTSSGPPTPEPTEGQMQAEQRRTQSPVTDRPPTLPEPAADSSDNDSVVDISWARKMIEDLEAESSSSDGGPRRGAADSRGDLADFDSGDDERARTRRSSSSSGSSFYNGTPSSANPPFSFSSPTGSTTFSIPQEPLSPSQESEVTPRVAQFTSPDSNPSSPSHSSTHTTTNTDAHLRHPSGAPFSPGNGSSNRRIAVMEASPGPSPSTSSSSFSDHTPPPQRDERTLGPRGLPEIPSHPTASASSSNLAERRGLAASRLAFVAPPDASKSSIGELRDAMDEMGNRQPRRGSKESAGVATPSGSSDRPRVVNEREPEVVNLDDDLDEPSVRSPAPTPEPPAPQEDLAPVDEDDDPDEDEGQYVRTSSHLREPGMAQSPALQAARERAKKARSVHLAGLQSFVPPSTASTSASSTSSSSSARPVLSADTSSAAFLLSTSKGDGPVESGLWTPAIGDSKELGDRVAGPQMIGMASSKARSGAGGEGTVERPRRSDMRNARTPSPTKLQRPTTDEQAPVGLGLGSHHVREPATAAKAARALPTPSSTLPASEKASTSPPITAPVLDASVSANSISNAQTLEELTAAVDRAINDAEIKESLALNSAFGVRRGSSPDKAPREIPASLRAERVEEDVGGMDLDDYVLVDEPSFSEPSSASLLLPTRPALTSKKSSSTPPAVVTESAGLLPSAPIDRPVVRRTTSLASLQSPVRPSQPPYSSNNPPRASSSMAHPMQSSNSASPYTGSGPQTPATPQYPIGKIREWPGAMVFTDIRLLRTPGEKANAYARKIAELGRSDSGLGDWVRAHSGYKENEPIRTSISSNRPSMASIHPHPSTRPASSLSASQTHQSSTSLFAPPASRNVSTSSAVSDDAFPIRAGHHTTAQNLRNVSPPSGPPANLPFPQLAVGMGMRSSASSASVRAGSGSSSGGGGFLQALGRRGSASGGSRPRFGGGLSKSPPTTLAALPSGRLSAESHRRPSARDLREMGISSPTGWTRVTGGPDGRVGTPPAGGSTPPVRTTTVNGPAGPRGRNPSLPGTTSSLNLSATASSPTTRRASEMDLPNYPAPLPPPLQSTRSSLSTHAEAPPPPPALASGGSGGQKDAELREMVEILGESEVVLAGYLRREGDYMRGITAYLEDKQRGAVQRG